MLFSFDNNDILRDYFNLSNPEKVHNDVIAKPNEGLILGNIFLDEYVPYKNYKPAVLKMNSEKERDLLKIRELSFFINDLNLKLDLDSNNKKLYDLFKMSNEKLKGLVKEYEAKYQVIELCDDLMGKYTWLKGPWPWEGDENV